LKALQEVATVLLEFDDRQLENALTVGEIEEVRHDNDRT